MDIQEKKIYFAMEILVDKMTDLKKEYFLAYWIKMQTYSIMKIVHFKYKNQKSQQQE